MRLGLLAASLCLPLLACAGADPDDGPSPFDDDYPVSSYDALLAGAPDNATLPDENKADAQYPQRFDLYAEQSPVKSQGSRGVCSIFATTALVENLYIKAGKPNPDFSEQYLQWSAKEQVRAFRNTEGSSGDVNLRAVSQYGIVEEALWPYERKPWNTTNDPACTGGENLPTKCYTNGAPPQAAVDGQKWKLPSGRWINTNSIKAHLTTKRSGVTVGMTFFYQAWNHRASQLPVNTDYWREGIVLYPNAKDKELSLAKRAGHAIHIIGWDDTKRVATVDENGQIVRDANGNPVMEQGFWIFKNSWGTGSFGVANAGVLGTGDGYGYLSMRYVAEYGSANVSDVPRYTPPAETCDNGVDDDGDQQIDCDDSQCATHAACQGSSTVHTYSASPAVAIPDNNTTGVSSAIAVAETGTVATVKVTLDLRHTYRGDLKVVLAHAGRTATLHERTGGADDNLTGPFETTAFAGAALDGEWTLTVSDLASVDTGTLNTWSIEVVAN